MERIAPAGDVYQAGTLSGNPLATAAGLAVLELIARDGVFEALEAKAERLAQELATLARDASVPFCASAAGGLFGFFFHPGPVRNYQDATKADAKRFRTFFHAMLDQGIYLAPSPYEAAFLTTAHADAELDETLEAARRAFKKAS
jgi:glutamate-1-semialdehyde 2,1-aminomutase